MPATYNANTTLPRLYTIDFNHTDSVRLADQLYRSNLQRRPQFLINCHHLTCLRTQGVSYLVSQLLLTKRAGADVLLYNVDAALDKALRLLGLHQVFQIVPAAE